MYDDLKNLVTQRMAQARQTLTDCLILIGVSEATARSVVSRAWFSAYGAVLALLETVSAKERPEPEAEEATLKFFVNQFVETGKVARGTEETLWRLREMHLDADYRGVATLGEDQAHLATQLGGRVYNAISEYLFNEGLLEETK